MKRLMLLLAAIVSVLCAQPKKVVVMGMSRSAIRELQEAVPEVKLVQGPGRPAAVTAVTADSPEAAKDREALLREVSDADGFIGGPTEEVIRAGKKLKWVQILSAGVDEYRYSALGSSDIVLTSGKVMSSPGIADHAFALLLALTRKVGYFAAVRTKEDWQRRPYNLLELKGKTAVVIGVGGIGSRVAQRAWGFEMNVIGVDPKDLPPSPFVQRMVYPDRLDTVLPLADVVFVCAPLTPESEGMLGPRQFELMKKGAFFIAVSRGKLYHTDSLVKALDSRKLAGAGLDVTEVEPLPKGHALWKFDNVIVTPHIATECDGETARRMELLKDNLVRFSRGEPLRNVVDKKKWY